jgi:hypothetical protein
MKNVNIDVIKKIDFELEFKKILKLSFLNILRSRVSLHVATIENSTLVPLYNGNNISDKLIQSLLNSD